MSTTGQLTPVGEAFAVLKQALQDDPEYAWSWQSNIAMAFYDELGPMVDPSALRHEVCNRAAARFMRLCFDVDTSKPPESSAATRAQPPCPPPDMSRMGEKHIKPCRGCGKLILWAKHEKPGGKVAPLIKTVAGETPNIMAWFDASQDRWIYKIKGAKSEVRGTPEYVNHFANCSHANDFKSESPNEQEERQAAIK